MSTQTLEPVVSSINASAIAQPSVSFPTALLLNHDSWTHKLQQGVKRLIDITGALVGLTLLSPVFLVLAALVKITSPGPIFYNSLRVGKQYQPFYMLKFRTMQVNADAIRDQLRAEANLEGNLFKLANDPRITPIGKMLRAFSLDELPQLVNVLKGEMSLVGPRPLPPDEAHLFEAPYTIRYEVLPGITGAWQVGGRSQLDFKQLCQLEFAYVRQWSVLKDIQILLKTVPAVLLSRGAC